MSAKIMIVDDEPANLRLLDRLFRRDYVVVAAESGEEALRLLNQHDVALLITDQRMPGMTGIELLKQTAQLRPHMVRMILTGYTDVAALVEAINCGHVYNYVTKPWDNNELRLTVERAIQHYETNRERHELGQSNRRLNASLQELTRGVSAALAGALEMKDPEAHAQARRVSEYACAIGRRLLLDANMIEELALAALLHDVGKIGTPDNLLQKPAPLSDQERKQAELHAERGARLLGEVPGLAEVAEAVRYHHEHYDGSGYPAGLSGEQIPLISRIIRVADAYDALTSPRPFEQPLDHDAALAHLMADAGKRFDPEVLTAFSSLESLTFIRRGIDTGDWSLTDSTTLAAEDSSSAGVVEQVCG